MRCSNCKASPLNNQSSAGSLFYIIISFLLIYFVWGATYLFVAFVVDEIPPFLASGFRYLIAAMIVFALAALFRQFQGVTRDQVKNALFAGVLFLGVGTGGVAWALQYVDTGFTSLIISSQPLVIVFMMWWFNGKRPPISSFIGSGIGIIGVFLLISQKEIVVDTTQWLGIITIFGCILTWGYATIYVSKADLPKSQMVNIGLQMLSGGTATFIFSLVVGEEWVDVNQLTNRAILSMGFLIVFGGIIVFTAFNYLLRNVTPDKVATSTYVNPIVAMVLGWWFRDEIITLQSVVAAVVILTGVFFINSGKSQ